MLTDPYESKNLALDLAYSDEVANYKEKLKGHQIRTWDPWYLKWQYE